MLKFNPTYKVSEDLFNFLVRSTGGAFPSARMEELTSLIEKEAEKYFFTKSSEANLIRIIGASYDKYFFLNDCLRYPFHVEIITAIAANSNYLTDIVVRNPELLSLVFDTSFLTKDTDPLSLKTELATALSRYKGFSSKLNFLRIFRRRMLLKTGINDILGNISLDQVTGEIALIAKAVSEALFALTLNEILLKYKTAGNKGKYCLAALGKLGGDELNYSSDVDFILFYEEDFPVKKGVYYSQVLTEAAHLFIQSATEVTDRGFLYRVDFRLRPDGRNSPLCRSVTEYMNYYEGRGEDWERQMLIKLSFSGGDKTLYFKFKNYISHFVYPSSFSKSPLEQIKRMKRRIELRGGDEENIKIISGGIRDIEFSIQALQLINGGAKHDIRTGNSLEAITALEKHSLLSSDEAAIFRESYIFYRKIEHYLQLMNDKQTHVIPAEGELTDKLAFFLGFNSREQFFSRLTQRRNRVRHIFNMIFNSEGDSEMLREEIPEINFKDQKKAEKNLEFLRTGTGLLGTKRFDKKTIELFSVIEPTLHDYLIESADPDLALDNLTRLIGFTIFPSIWYKEFTSRKFFTDFLDVCSYSSRAIELLCTDHSLEEMYITRRVFSKELASWFEVLNIRQIRFVLAVQLALRLIPFRKFSRVLHDYYKSKLREILLSVDPAYDYFLAGLGSFGASEMTFASDLDLIVVVRNVEDIEQANKDFQKFLMYTRERLNPLEIDFRLRPEGRNSPLVADLEQYKKYLASRAQVWEYQSFAKMRFIAGKENLYEEFTELISENIKRFEKEPLKTEINDMLKKVRKQGISGFGNIFNIKKSRGGILDLDFLTQYLHLSDKESFQMLAGRDIPGRLMFFTDILTQSQEIEQAYAFLKETELVIQNLFNTNNSILPGDQVKRKMIANGLKINLRDFEEKLKQSINIISANYDQIMRG